MVERTALAGKFPRGFTLIELMLVVTIIGVLGSIAIPGFRTIALKAREAERTTYFAQMKRDILGYYKANGKIPECFSDWNPGWPVGKSKPFKPNMNSCWRQMPWGGIDGATRFIWYYGAWPISVGGKPRQQFYIYSLGDLDGDGLYTYRTLLCVPDEMKECLGGGLSYEGKDSAPDKDELDYYPPKYTYYP